MAGSKSLACDVILAVPHATFALPEPRVGLAALAGGLLRLPRAVGEKRAAEIALTGRTVAADEAERISLVHRLVPADALVDQAVALGLRMARYSPLSLAATLAAIDWGRGRPLDDATASQMRLPSVRALFASDHVREGPLAFAEKRAPNWS